MKIKELRKLDKAKLNEQLSELRNKTRELRFSIANNQLKKVRDLRSAKQDIAKILTVLNEKRLNNDTKEAVKDDKTEESK